MPTEGKALDDTLTRQPPTSQGGGRGRNQPRQHLELGPGAPSVALAACGLLEPLLEEGGQRAPARGSQFFLGFLLI